MKIRQRSSGFTLIELLVVIAIIAILAAILFPVFLTAKLASKRSQCLSNLKQLGQVMINYANDYESHIPNWTTPANGNIADLNKDGSLVWDEATFRYAKNQSIYACPVNNINPATGKRWQDSTGKYVRIRSYALPKNVAAQIIEQVPKPSATVLLYEKGSCMFGVSSDATGEYFKQTFGADENGVRPEQYWHGPGKNFLFCDGHAKYFKYPQGPFSYVYPSFAAWSTPAYVSYIGDMPGYCGYANFKGAGNPTGGPMLPGANLPR